MGNRDGGGHASPLGSGRAAAITMAHDTSVAVARRRGEIAGSGPWNQDPYPNGLGSFAVSQRFALYIAPPADDPLHAFAAGWLGWDPETGERSEEHTSELQSLMRISYAVFCLNKKTLQPYYTQY